MKIIKLDCVDSTNEWCKQNDGGKDVAVIAEYQTAGKGTKGRSFVSDKGGIYLSVMRHYTDFAAANAFKILINACVAVCKTLNSLGVKPVIRWSNDIMVNGKKISGTLIENTFSNGFLTRSIVGIGININNGICDSLSDIATSIKKIKGFSVDKQAVFLQLLQNLENEYSVAEYKSFMPWLGDEIILKTPSGEFAAVAEDISQDGRLICIADGEKRTISSAEVSIRF